MSRLRNASYRQCIVPDCDQLPIFAIIVDRPSGFGRFRVTTILTCSEHTEEGDELAKRDYPDYARQIFDNPPWLEMEQQAEERYQQDNSELYRILEWDRQVRALHRGPERLKGL